MGVVLALLALMLPVAMAQNTPSVAYVNAGGQLVIASGDGASRWVVTNPGETLAPAVNLAWSEDGRVLFGVQTGSGVSLRVASPGSQAINELGLAPAGVSGGAWLADGRALVATRDGLTAFGNGSSVIVPGAQLTAGSAVSPDGRFLFYAKNGQFAVNTTDGTRETLLGGASNPTSAGVGLWADTVPIVAYWTFDNTGTAALNATLASSPQNSISLPSGSAVPVTPLDWVPGSAVILFRSATGVYALDLGCVQTGCGDLSSQVVPVLPVNAADVTVSRGALVFTLDGNLYASPTSCINSGTCAQDALAVAPVARNTPVSVQGSAAAFTGSDGAVYAVNLACVSAGACTPAPTGASGTVSGVSEDGLFVLVSSGGELVAVSLGNMGAVALTGVNATIRPSWSG